MNELQDLQSKLNDEAQHLKALENSVNKEDTQSQTTTTITSSNTTNQIQENTTQEEAQQPVSVEQVPRQRLKYKRSRNKLLLRKQLLLNRSRPQQLLLNGYLPRLLLLNKRRLLSRLLLKKSLSKQLPDKRLRHKQQLRHKSARKQGTPVQTASGQAITNGQAPNVVPLNTSTNPQTTASAPTIPLRSVVMRVRPWGLILSGNTIFRRANADLNERNGRILSSSGLNQNINTYDPAIYSQLKVVMDASVVSSVVAFHLNLTADPWSYTGKSNAQLITTQWGDQARVQYLWWGNTGYTVNTSNNTFDLAALLICRNKNPRQYCSGHQYPNDHR